MWFAHLLFLESKGIDFGSLWIPFLEPNAKAIQKPDLAALKPETTLKSFVKTRFVGIQGFDLEIRTLKFC